MTCPDCTAATERDWYGYSSQCKDCNARAVSRGSDFDRCKRYDPPKLDAGYRKVLERTQLTHAEVKAAYLADRVNSKESD